MNKSYAADIVIIGAGIAGLTLACLLQKYSAYRIILLERNHMPDEFLTADQRSPQFSAVNAYSVKLWQQLGVWQEQELQVSPYLQMQLWDYCGGMLAFEASNATEKILGYIVQNALLQQKLLAQRQRGSQVRLLTDQTCIAISQNNDEVCLELQDAVLHAKYLIGCDGAQSWVREQLDFALTTWPYEHTAITAQLTTENHHGCTARQKFTVEGPLAFLPLCDAHQSSVVWSVPTERAKVLMALSNQDFLAELMFTSEEILGKMSYLTQRFTFPLTMRHAKNYVKERVILCADAAHTIHPLAGQGLNLAMQDIVALADVFIGMPSKVSFSGRLRQYERARKAENWQMIVLIEAIKRIYQIKSPLLQGVIQSGVQCINKAQPLKSILMKIAQGDHIPFPSWLIENH